MSWYMNVTGLKVNTKTKDIELLFKNRVMNSLKVLCEVRCDITDDIPTLSYSMLGSEIYDKIKESLAYYTNENVATVRISDLDKFENTVESIPHSKNKIAIVTDDVAEKVKTDKTLIEIPSKEFIDYPENFISVDVKVKHYQNFQLYDEGCFANYTCKLETKIDELKKKKWEFEKLKSSLDYLKLSDEEKENVNNEFDYLDEEIQDLDLKITACWKIEGVLEVFDCYGDNKFVVAIFGD